jgi:GNAT superfamily N-acetyltransferase
MEDDSAAVVVRAGALSDAETIAAFQIRMADETEGLALEPETVRRGVAAVFDDPARGRYWVAEVGGRVAGSLLIVPEWSDWRNGTVWWIHSLYVRPACRRRGVFRALFEHVRGLVESDDSLMGLRLYVEQGNAAARATYERMGMDGDHYRLYEWLKPLR